MEMGDYMRNMSFDINARKTFDSKLNGQLDRFGNECTKFNGIMDKLLLSYNKLNSNGLELKKMAENLEYSQHVVQRNLWDRGLRTNSEREQYKSTETYLNNVSFFLTIT
jgi:hypothetical protein